MFFHKSLCIFHPKQPHYKVSLKCLAFFKILFEIPLYCTKTLSSILKDIFLPLLSKCPLKVSTHLRQYNIPLSPCSTLLHTTILFISTESKTTGCLEAWNSFLLTSILLHFNVFSLIFMLYQNVNILPQHYFSLFFLLSVEFLYLFLPYSLFISFSFSQKFLNLLFAFCFITSLFSI